MTILKESKPLVGSMSLDFGAERVSSAIYPYISRTALSCITYGFALKTTLLHIELSEILSDRV